MIGLLFLLLHISTLLRHVVFRVFMPFPMTVSAISSWWIRSEYADSNLLKADSLLMHLKLHQFLLPFGLLEDECQSRITRDHQNQRGFGIPLLPNYNATIGAAWLERGGQYVEAR